MDTVFLGFIIFLFILAAFDLIVGVSNDAVNFLNSGVGSKIAPLKVLIIVAATGILLGSALSNGMIEIARNGIYRPEMFSFQDLMYIMLAVMISDIILLDIFNNLGLPTSTTVSMVFELMGGTFALSLFRIASDSSVSLSDLMNTEKALTVIIAIFVSVAIAFFSGTLVQWISRLIFTFGYKKHLKWKIGIFGGIAATCIMYFMLIKGMKDVSFMTKEHLAFINEHSMKIFGGCFVFFTVLMQILYFLKVNVFKILVLFGTFSLAAAFAGNDLVNFIGVPLAGFSAYTDYIANGNGDATGYMMSALQGPAQTPIYFLMGAGLIMTIALATSKKAHNVIKTSVDLSKQNDGDEMFGSSKIARVIVRIAANACSFVSDIVPDKVKASIEKRFDINYSDCTKGAAFDEIRATVNLVVSALLIALGTSLKLPLSTTYVTFMVAMGSSLADRAWGRESAVFRITGVMSVIAGWFVTAGAAFILCFLFASVMKIGGPYVSIATILFGIFILIRSNIKFRKKVKEENGDTLYNEIIESTDKEERYRLLSLHIFQNQTNFINFITNNYKNITDGFIEEKLSLLSKSQEEIRKQRVVLKNIRRKEMIAFKLIDENKAIRKSTWFHLVINSSEDCLYCLRRMCDACLEHIDNTFTPLEIENVKAFKPLRDTILYLTSRVSSILENGDYDSLSFVLSECDKFKSCLKDAGDAQLERMRKAEKDIKVSYVYLNLLQESETLVSSLKHFIKAVRMFNKD